MKKIIALLGFFAPVAAFAQGGFSSGLQGQAIINQQGGNGQATTFGYILGVIQGLLNILVPLLITAGVAWFIWGVVQFVTSGDAEKKEQGQQHMIQGIIGIFVIVSIWGLVAILQNTFGVSGNSSSSLTGSGTLVLPQ